MSSSSTVGFGEWSDVHSHVSLFVLQPCEMAEVARVNRSWSRGVASNDVVWKRACARTWAAETFVVSRTCRAMLATEPREALRTSLADAKRPTIDAETLCSMPWWFRFKKQAGMSWTSDDPFWRGDGARELEFVPAKLDGHPGVVRWHRGSPDDDVRIDGHPHGQMRWRLDQQNGPDGLFSVLRVKHDHFNREFPGVKMIRHPNGGFVLHSVWVVYASFKMTRDDHDAHMTDRALARSVDTWQWNEVEAYNTDLAGEEE